MGKAGVTQSGVEAAFRGGDHTLQEDPSCFEDPVEAASAMFGAMDTDGDGRVTCDEFLAFYNMMADNGMQMNTAIKAFSASVGFNSSNSSSAESGGLVTTVFTAVYGKLVCGEVQALTAVWHHLAAGDVKAGVTQGGVEAAFRGGDHSFQDEPSFFEDPAEAA